MKVWKNLNSQDTKFATWTNEDERENNLPTTLPDGGKIPINNFGINVQSLNIYYWDGTQWQSSGE